MLQGGGGARLALEIEAAGVVGLVFVDEDLDGDLAHQAMVFGLIHGPHAALSEAVLDLVTIRDQLRHGGRVLRWMR
jgi:hypothetical protein